MAAKTSMLKVLEFKQCSFLMRSVLAMRLLYCTFLYLWTNTLFKRAKKRGLSGGVPTKNCNLYAQVTTMYLARKKYLHFICRQCIAKYRHWETISCHSNVYKLVFCRKLLTSVRYLVTSAQFSSLSTPIIFVPENGIRGHLVFVLSVCMGVSVSVAKILTLAITS